MSLHFDQCDYGYLIPPKEVFDVTHTDYYIRHGKGSKCVRKVFDNNKFYEDEEAKLAEFQALIASEKVQLPEGWKTVDTFRFMYSGKLDLKKSLKILKQHLEWRASPERGIVGEKARKLMEEGIMYISGRDKQFRPIIVVNAHRCDLKKNKMEDFVQTISFVLDTARKFYFVPGKVENWVIIIESNGAGVLDFPSKLVKAINDIAAVNYTSTLDKLYIMNPSTFIKKSWNLIQGLIDPETATKINMLQKEDFPQLLERIDIDQIEQCYGGKLPKRTVFWPPVNTLNKPPYTEAANPANMETELKAESAVHETITFENQVATKKISYSAVPEKAQNPQDVRQSNQELPVPSRVSVKAIGSSANVDGNKENDVHNQETGQSAEPSQNPELVQEEVQEKEMDDIEEWALREKVGLESGRKKVRVVASKSPEPEEENEAAQQVDNEQEDAETNRVSFQMRTKNPKNGAHKTKVAVSFKVREEEHSDVVLEKNEPITLCNFCSPKTSSDDSTTSGCTIF